MRNSLIQLFVEMEEQLIEKIDQHLQEFNNKEVERKWVKSSEVSEMLSCSPATLFRLRTEGILPCSLIQGTYYYKLSDIDQMMEEGKEF
ncbi:helix-turn-helix domain-containing protein [Flavobacteriales bacterium]|jgi:hypothetical protein|nr:helix-turn-helix domain-containing protein [Flavobacteriales bacterium]